MRKSLFLTIFFLLLSFSNAFAQNIGQSIYLKQGFNFISFTVQPAITATQLKQDNLSLIDDLYLYNSSAGSFLSLSEGTLTTISAGKGYILKAKTDGTLDITGTSITTIPDLSLKTGFNLIGLSQTISSNTFSNIIRTYGIIKGIYKWSSTAGAFIQVIKDYNGTPQLIDSVDPQFKTGESYFINVYDNTTLSFTSGSINFIGGTIPTNTEIPAAVLSDLPTAEQKTGYGNIEGEISPTFSTGSPVNRIINIVSLSNIKVWVKNHPEINTVTDSNGKFVLKNVPAAAKGSGHTIEYEKNEGEEVFKGVVKDVPVIEKKKIDLKPYIGPSVIKKTGAITGKIALSDGLSPLGAEIYIPAISGLIAKADEDGTFNILYIPEGTFNLVAYANGYEIYKTEIIISAGEIKSLNSIILNKKTIAALDSYIDGYVIDENSAPIANANLSLLSDDLKTDIGTSTSITGHYRFNNVPAGKYKIYITKDQFIGFNTDETLITGQNKFINISLKKAQNIINTYAMVSGKLMMKGTDIPLRNAIIVTSPPTQQYFTDFDGTFNFLLPAGSLTIYKIFYKKAGFIDFSSEISLKADESISIQDILLQPLTNDLIPATIDFNISTLTIKEGESLQLNATVRDNIGNIITGQKVDWSLNNTNGFITLSGLFSAIKAGDVEITAKCAGITKTINIKIEASASVISQLKITSESIGFETGKVYKFNLVAISNDGKVTIIPASMASWELSPVNANVIISEGSLVSSTAYNGIIKVTYNQQTASKLINIIAAVADTTPPSISHIPPVLKPASTLELKCIVTDNKNVEKAILYFKKAGAAYENSPWSIIPMDRVITTENNYSNEYSYAIPASFITTDGIKYYIAANDMSQNKSYYPAEGELKPVTLLPTTSGYVSTIKGRVVITGTNTPISDAQVIFSAGDGIIVKTDASGNFIINGQFAIGLFSLTSTKLGKIGEKSLEITASQYGTEITDITIEMEQPKLTKIEIEKTQDQIGMNQKYDLSKLSVTAYYDNNQSKTIIPKWLVDKGTLENLIYSPLQQIYTATLTATYTESGINKITYLTLNIINDNVKSLGQLSLSKTAETVLTSSLTYNLAQVNATAYYSDGSIKSIIPTWTLAQGNGTISGTTYTLPTSAGTSTLVASYTESNATKTAELLLTIQQIVILPTVASPTISPAAGTYTAPQTLTISCSTSGATLKYTTDGSTPSASNGLTYTIPIAITQTAAIKIIAIKSGMIDSTVISASFIINTQPTPGQTITIDLGNGVTLEMVKILAGTFQMGSQDNEPGRSSDEGPVHTVNITNDFYIGKYEITQGQWKAIMSGNNPSSAKLGDNYPVESVTWNDCQNFINNINTYYSNYGQFRLPTEAEWEYACRASTTTPYYWGSTISDNYFWYSDNSGNTLHPVGQKSPNSFGLYDMSGNVWEWCNDWYGNYASISSSNPSGPASGTYRVFRSGGWSSGASHCRSAKRFPGDPASSGRSGGFRIVLPSLQTPAEKVGIPSISPNGGTFNSAQEITIISATSGATIKYTTDGTTPSATNGLTYTSPLTLSQTSTIKAVAIKTGMTTSDIVTSNFVIQSLVAWWKFDEGTGTSALDSSGNNFTCTVQNPQWADGVIGKCLTFNGSSTSVRGDANSKLSLTNLTLSAWVKPTGNGTNNPRIVAVGPAGTTAQHYVMALDGGARVVAFGRESVLPLQPVNSNTPITNDNKWHQITVTFDGNIIKHYIDGVLDKSTISTVSPKQFSSVIIQIGFSDSGADRFQGLIDDIKIYNYALPETEITNYYNLYKPIEKISTPVLSPAAGMYISTQPITISCSTIGATIKYTTDGSEPSATNGITYSGPFTLNSSQTIKVIAYKDGLLTSDVLSMAYNIVDVSTPKIIFDPTFDGNNELYMINIDGTNKIRLTNNNYIDQLNTQILKHNKIVFWSNRDGNLEIYTCDLAGNNVIRLTVNSSDDMHPSFSPDGSQIIFQTQRSGNWEIYMMNEDGTNQRKITAGICPAFSEDGTKIIFSNVTSTGNEIFTANVDGSNIVRITNDAYNDFHSQYSNDNLFIYFNSARNEANYQIYSFNLATQSITKLTNINASCSRHYVYNEKIIFEAVDSNSIYTLYMMNKDGSNLQVIVTDPKIIGKVQTPLISVASGTYSAIQQILVTCSTADSIIKYTTDGSAPSAANGMTYSSAITVAETTTLKVVAIKTNMTDSDLASATYTITIPPQTLSLDLGDGVMLEMAKIPAGTFQMGDVGVTDAVPVHTVTILKDYYIGKSEITQAQWLKIFGSWPGTAPSATYAVGNDYPAYSVSWDDICSTGGFLEKINILKPNSYGAFRLPTEAEWEYACRGNTTTAFYWGDTINNDYCWYNSNSGGKTHPVGTTLAGLNSANSFGLFDMSGNVFEWCSDWYGTYSGDSVTDPTGPASGTKRVLRGGTWVNAAIYNRSGARHFDLSTYRSAGVGFRVVLPISQ
ncbi:MAG: hypothetical protein ACD_59C00014G0003 [uncultured bacterium]|nr:MAG: hypothetical protein ACD_59C00014G0003 [uncultured bacterium]